MAMGESCCRREERARPGEGRVAGPGGQRRWLALRLRKSRRWHAAELPQGSGGCRPARRSAASHGGARGPGQGGVTAAQRGRGKTAEHGKKARTAGIQEHKSVDGRSSLKKKEKG